MLSASVLIVDSRVDSMGGVDGGITLANRISPRKAAVEKVQAELRQEYDVREARKRELEFLEKGGDPLDFMFGNDSSVGVYTASFTHQQPNQCVTCEAKGSFGFTLSAHGDSVESSGRPEAPPDEPNSADSLLLFDAEHESSEGGRNSSHPREINNLTSEQSTQMDVSHVVWDGNSASFSLPRKSYKRRNRSGAIRDGIKLNSTDINPILGSNGSSLPSHYGSRDVKGLVSDEETCIVSSICNSKPASPLNGAFRNTDSSDGKRNIELETVKPAESTKDLAEGVSLTVASDDITSENLLDKHLNQQAISTNVQIDSNRICAVKEMNSAFVGCQPSLVATEVQNGSSSCQTNGFNNKNEDGMTKDTHSGLGLKRLDSESSCSQTSLSFEGNKGSEMRIKAVSIESHGNSKDQTLATDILQNIDGGDLVKEGEDNEVSDSSTLINDRSVSACKSQVENGFEYQPDTELNQSGSALNNCPTESESTRNTTGVLVDTLAPRSEILCNHRNLDPTDSTSLNLLGAELLSTVSDVPLKLETCSSNMKVLSEVDEDSILKEAEVIEAKRKRIMELSMPTSPVTVHEKSHWDYVLEEMSWLANDFAQERIWKITAAAQICRQVAFSCQLRKHGKSSNMDVNKVAHTLAKAVMEFWGSLEERSKYVEEQRFRDGTRPLQAYAVRFQKYNNQSEIPSTPDILPDSGVLHLSWDMNLPEENLFYTIHPGAMETYRKSIESHVAQCERIGCNAREEVETSAYDGVEYQGAVYDGDEGESNMYDTSSFRFGKKRKQLSQAYDPRMYEIGSGSLPSQHFEDKVFTQHSSLLAKQPGSSLKVSIPTKRVRTAFRRVISAVPSGCVQQPIKNDASSGDTNSFQDDQSTLRRGSCILNNVEVESIREFGKKMPFDSKDVSTKLKKKKAKHMNDAYEHRRQGHSSFQHEQRDNLKKRPDSHQLESHGSSGLLGQPFSKKPKITRQSYDNSFNYLTSFGGPPPAASQISNMSSPNKFMKLLSSRDRGRKSKVPKVPNGQPGSGTSWSPFEEQALVVFAHDLGPNWELVSDAINSSLHFKCVFRKAKECKEHHIFLTERTLGDGADSAEDSGSTQPYFSTLPGIPKGQARKLLECLQAPVEEGTLKTHFEKIIMIGRKQQNHKTQVPKQRVQPHSTHADALSDFNGGTVLTPLDLCNDAVSSPDILPLGYHGSHASGLAFPGQGTGTLLTSPSVPTSTLQGSPNMLLANSFPSLPGHPNSSLRDCHYMVPRSASLSVEERIQQYNNLLIPGRNIPPSSISSPGAIPGADRGIRILPGGNGVGMLSGLNRSMLMARPGLRGIASPSLVNAGSMVPPGLAPVNMHSGVGSGQGRSMLRPREASHIMRPGLTQDSPRQLLVPELQIPGNSHGVPQFGAPFPNQASSPVSPYPLQHQPHAIPPQQPQVLGCFQGPPNQAYAFHFAKERLPQHRFQQQQQKFASSNSLVHQQVQLLPQHPVSSPVQNSSQAVLPSLTVPPSTPPSSTNSMPQQKHLIPSQGVIRNAQASVSSGNVKQRQKQQQQQQQLSQANRQHPQQRQLPLAQQQVMIAKGVERGSAMMHQTAVIDPSLVNGVSSTLGNNPCFEKGAPTVHLMQNQGLCTGSTVHPAQPTRQYVSTQSSNLPTSQQTLYSGRSPTSPKKLHSNSQSDDSNLGNDPPVPCLALADSNQVQSHQLASENTCHVLSDPSIESQVGEARICKHAEESSTEMDAVATLPQACENVTNAHQRDAPEPLDGNLSSSVSVPLNSSESVQQSGQGPQSHSTVSQPPLQNLQPMPLSHQQ